MKLIKVAGAVLNQTPLDWERNQKHILDAIEDARAEKVSILCLPELCISGYGCEDSFYSMGVLEECLKRLFIIKEHTQGMIVSLGLPILYKNRIFNAACLVVNTKIIGFVAKRFLAGNGIHYEPRWFTPWPESTQCEIELKNPLTNQIHSFPMGDIYFDVNDIKIGFEICEDAWVANRPGRKLYQAGVDLILNPSASHFAFGKLDIRKRFVLEGSRAFGVAYIYANLLGNESGRAIFDGGTIIASSGNLLAQGKRFSYKNHELTTATIDIEEARMAQSQASTIFNIPKMQNDCIKVNFNYPEIKSYTSNVSIEEWEKSDRLQEEEFTRAVSLGLFDYLRKSYSGGFVISLSGGADSAAVTCLCFLALKLAEQSIGLQGLKDKLHYLSLIQNCKSVSEISKYLITTAYQPTENSGDVTLNAAREVAKAVHAEFHILDVNPVFKEYIAILEKSLGRKLTWQTDDITLQNVQARVRSPSIWMFANIKNALLLATSNRSEAAVGYATMDGDTSGGLSPIAGIDKHFLRVWLRWMETNGAFGIEKIPELSLINNQQPTAELRPQESKQTDEDDLMPYDLLDFIEEAAIRDKKMPIPCYYLASEKFKMYSKSQIKSWVVKFFKLWSRNQWKRERFAPSFHLDDKNLDPKTWCRFPILSGGFTYEIAELEKLNE